MLLAACFIPVARSVGRYVASSPPSSLFGLHPRSLVPLTSPTGISLAYFRSMLCALPIELPCRATLGSDRADQRTRARPSPELGASTRAPFQIPLSQTSFKRAPHLFLPDGHRPTVSRRVRSEACDNGTRVCRFGPAVSQRGSGATLFGSSPKLRSTHLERFSCPFISTRARLRSLVSLLLAWLLFFTPKTLFDRDVVENTSHLPFSLHVAGHFYPDFASLHQFQHRQ
jgi:hypothetical protein